jgi:hypothetical protein
MKAATLYFLLGTLLLGAGGCTKEDDPVVELPYVPCALTSSYAKPVTDLEGVIRFDQALQQYVVWRAIPGTYDSVDVGVVCGNLPAAFKTAGTKVRFSGIYRGYGQPAPASPAGTSYYYLELTKIAKL